MDELKPRLRILLIIFGVVFFAIFIRIVDLQILSPRFYTERAIQQTKMEVTLAASRGDILDRNGRLLATSINTCSVGISLSEVENKDLLAEKLADVLGIGKNEILSRLTGERGFFWLKRKMDLSYFDKITKAIRESGLMCFVVQI